ncbi:inactive tyrosine-protein kinase 7 isoform X1 [Denticeps clupeoides]|uniref:Inactive tyrosine-protein kinase 7 n=1 Tax=Denticeps clupeoides TaxID=299321 RepID=A0AAY4EIB1_9TELE|nr:inactive tyrosine-protein kinase 7 isoform X1 [Denticeps clupeoides]
MERRVRTSAAPLPSRLAAGLSVGVLLGAVLCIQASAIYFSKEPTPQDALNGRSAMMSCEVNIPTNVVYSWLRNGEPVHNTERRFQEGSDLKFTAIDRHLDTGMFQCVASNTVTGETARSVNASFNIKWLESGGVTLKEPASEAKIESSQPVTLRCHIDGHPRPNYKWYKDGVQLTERSHQINNKERTLTVKSASPDDSGLYYCCAHNPLGQVCSNKNFTLDIVDKSFPVPVVVPEDQVVFRNQEAVFHCQFTAEPPPMVQWFHESEPVFNKTRLILYNNGTLLITQVKQRSTGTYRCVAHGPTGRDVTLQATLYIAEINEMDPIMPRVFTADTLERVKCYPPSGHPEPEVWWEHRGRRVPTVGRVYQDGTDLVFSPTNGSDSDSYTCVAKNKAGERRQQLTVTVATRPEWVTPPQDTEMLEGQAGYLHCHARATPTPHVVWRRGTNIITEEDPRFRLFPNGTLRINSVEVYDGVIYSCQSKTEGGFLMGHAKVTVLEKLKFTPVPQPTQCLELDKEISIQCIATGRQAPKILWSKADGSPLPPWVEQKEGTLRFGKVLRSDAGNYTCTASNSLQGEIRAFVSLTVAVSIEFKMVPEYTTVYQGHTAILHCQATGDPSPHIQWMVKEKMLLAKEERVRLMPNGSLVISGVTTDDTGRYTCVAGNSCGISDSSTQLYVVEKPIHLDSDQDKTPYKMIQTIGLSVGVAVAYIIAVLGLMFYCKQRRNAKRLQKSQEGEEPEMECLNGGAMLHNGQTTAEIQEEVALTNLGTTASAEKRHSSNDKLHFPRVNLQTITTLGKGEFGEVLLAKAKGIVEGEEQTLVLVKSLQARDEQLQQDFRREADMFAKLSHPNVVQLLGLCRDAEPHYIILEYMDLGDLKQFVRISKGRDEKMKSQALSTKTKVSLCMQVAQGMEHLSNQRFVHRDLAARNCMISDQRHVKVSALGLSKDVYKSEYYHYRQAWIPLRWMPTEAVFEDDFSTKSDVWSFGVLMWEVFSYGELPYTKLSNDQVLEGLQSGKLKLPPLDCCPFELHRLLEQCWAPSPKERPTFSELVHALANLPSDSKV